VIAETWQIGVHDPGDPCCCAAKPPSGSTSPSPLSSAPAGRVPSPRSRSASTPPQEGWPVLKGLLANLAVASSAHLVQVIRHGLKKIQYQPVLAAGYKKACCAQGHDRQTVDSAQLTRVLADHWSCIAL
jgi:hypothetical protein